MTEKPAALIGKSAAKTVKRKLADGTVKTYTYERKALRPRIGGGALREIFNAYSVSPEFKRLSRLWKSQKLKHFSTIEDRLGWMTLADLAERSARTEFFELRDAFADEPHKADKIVQALAAALSWAYDRGRIDVNHAARLPRLAEPRRDVAIYTEEQEAALLAELPPALANVYRLALYTGARRSDLIRLKWSDIGRDGWLVFRPGKTETTTAVDVHIPTRELGALARLLDELPRAGETILVRASGKPWDSCGVSKAWQAAMIRAGLVGMRLHDVRHTTATRLVEAGATEAERAAVMGHALAVGSGTAYVARTRALSSNAFRKWHIATEGAEVIPLEIGRRKTGKGGAK